MPGNDLRAPAAAFEFGVNVAAQQPHAGPRAVVDAPRFGGWAVGFNEVELASGSAVEAVHRSSVL